MAGQLSLSGRITPPGVFKTPAVFRAPEPTDRAKEKSVICKGQTPGVGVFVLGLILALGCSPAAAQARPSTAKSGAKTNAAKPRAQAQITANATEDATDSGQAPVETAPVDPRTEDIRVDVYDPGGEALASFHKALAAAEAGKGQARIAWYGASHTAADLWSGQVRRVLQGRFGDAGHGYLLPYRWHGGYRHQDVVLKYARGWKTHRHKLLNPVPIGDYGYGGVAISSDNPSHWFSVKTCTDNVCGRFAGRFEVWLRGSRKGGTLLVTIDGKEHAISTKRRRGGVIYKRFDFADGAHQIRARPKGDGRVYVYGAVFERKGPGVIVDQMGIPGMRGKIQLHWETAAWRDQLRRRDPHLVILAYGTNATGDKGAPISRFVNQWRRVLERLKNAVPRASCLLVGPTDRPLKPDEEGVRAHRPRIDAVVAAQKRVAAEYGCGFWDAFAMMGGRGSMVRWVNAGLAGRDHVHLTREGYELKAARFLDAILRGYK